MFAAVANPSNMAVFYAELNSFVFIKKITQNKTHEHLWAQDILLLSFVVLFFSNNQNGELCIISVERMHKYQTFFYLYPKFNLKSTKNELPELYSMHV